ncbi:MAG: hypothetical protein GX113_04070 [Actinobacteria bacterium]|nr:hypothetical protein [Actinomycetota bacterium]
MAKRVVFAILLFALVFGAASMAGCGDALPGDAVVKIGSIAVKEDAFNQRVKDFAGQYGIADKATDPEAWSAFEAQVLEYLVTYNLAAQNAGKLDVSVTDEEVQAEVDAILDGYYGGDQQALVDDLAEAGLTLDKLKANYKESMLLQRVYEKVIEDVEEPTDADIAAYYEENKDAFQLEETRTVRHILIKPANSVADDTTSEITDADWADALTTAKKVRNLLIGGGDWTQLAAEYSDDTYSASRGGDVGAIEENGEMVPEFEDAAFSLKAHEISEPVKSMFGYHVIQVTEISEARLETLEEARESISAQLLYEKQGEAWLKWLDSMKTELGVTYREDMQTTTTVSTEPTVTTNDSTGATVEEESTATSAGQTITTTDTTPTTAAP